VTQPLRIALAQLDFFVGDVEGNAARVLSAAADARDRLKADLVVFPELTLSGYPPEDLLFHGSMRRKISEALGRVVRDLTGIAAIVGYPEYDGRAIYNSAALIDGGRIVSKHRKECLPNYKVFDEKRYFTASPVATVTEFHGIRLGLLICEDIWEVEPSRRAKAAGAELLIVTNGSPYEINYQARRERVARDRVSDVGLAMLYVNVIGGQDELVFEGGAFAMNSSGEVVRRAPAFKAGLYLMEVARQAGKVEPVPGEVVPWLAEEPSVYNALVLGVRDYVEKHHFPGVIIGLSGGVDSALTLTIAVDAIGADRVQAVMMPSRYTSKMSLEDSAAQARRLGVKHSVISIEGMFAATLDALKHEFEGTKPDTTEENIQARCRGLLLMAISNKTGRMLLTTGNKSEMAVGYATLYGDMAGGFAPIKDCSKLLVYRLAHYRNSLSPDIPERVLTRAPSAELRADQKDSDSLPPYEVLDPILEAFIQEDLSVDEIAARGFDRATVGRVLEMVKRNEYKRRQAPPGVRVSGRAFGRDWRYPITSGYRSR
jgi:NAD+ synthase (glutamine-hydrolysing)